MNAFLVEIRRERGVPAFIRSDNGPGGIARHLLLWRAVQEIGPRSIGPGSPWHNGVAGGFLARRQDELLHLEVFDSARHAQVLLGAGRTFDHRARPQERKGSHRRRLGYGVGPVFPPGSAVLRGQVVKGGQLLEIIKGQRSPNCRCGATPGFRPATFRQKLYSAA